MSVFGFGREEKSSKYEFIKSLSDITFYFNAPLSLISFLILVAEIFLQLFSFSLIKIIISKLFYLYLRKTFIKFVKKYRHLLYT